MQALPGIITSLLLALLLSGCAGQQRVLPLTSDGNASPDRVELSDTPFIPQTRYQCGPAALATLLQSSGIEVSTEQLAPQVYLPQRKGSLQVELLATSRRYNRIPYLIDPDIGSLISTLQSGYPVIVLQNLGLAAYPLWHYAVVIGYSRADDLIILRSGTEERKTVSARIFLRAWRASENWGLLLLRPGELPPKPDRQRYLGAVAAMEGIADSEAVLAAYAAAVQHWPEDSSARFALANTFFREGRLQEAEEEYLKVLAFETGHVASMNNLAELYADQGCFSEALKTINRAIVINAPDSPLHATLLETRQAIGKRFSESDAATCSFSRHEQ